MNIFVIEETSQHQLLCLTCLTALNGNALFRCLVVTSHMYLVFPFLIFLVLLSPTWDKIPSLECFARYWCQVLCFFHSLSVSLSFPLSLFLALYTLLSGASPRLCSPGPPAARPTATGRLSDPHRWGNQPWPSPAPPPCETRARWCEWRCQGNSPGGARAGGPPAGWRALCSGESRLAIGQKRGWRHEDGLWCARSVLQSRAPTAALAALHILRHLPHPGSRPCPPHPRGGPFGLHGTPGQHPALHLHVGTHLRTPLRPHQPVHPHLETPG